MYQQPTTNDPPTQNVVGPLPLAEPLFKDSKIQEPQKDPEAETSQEKFNLVLLKFLESRGVKVPIQEPINIYTLFKVVSSLGGMHNVTLQNLWQTVVERYEQCDKLQLQSTAGVQPDSQQFLRKAYVKYLYEYERHLMFDTGCYTPFAKNLYPNVQNHCHPVMDPMNILTAPVIPAFRLPKAISPTVPTTGSNPGFAGPPTTMVQPPIRRPSSTVGIKRSSVGDSFNKRLLHALQIDRSQLEWALDCLLEKTSEGLLAEEIPGLCDALLQALSDISRNTQYFNGLLRKIFKKFTMIVPILSAWKSAKLDNEPVNEATYRCLKARVFDTPLSAHEKIIAILYNLSIIQSNQQDIANSKFLPGYIHIMCYCRDNKASYVMLCIFANIASSCTLLVSLESHPQSIPFLADLIKLWPSRLMKWIQTLHSFLSCDDLGFISLTLTILRRVAKSRLNDQVIMGLQPPIVQRVGELTLNSHAVIQTRAVGVLRAWCKCAIPGYSKNLFFSNEAVIHSLIHALLKVSTTMCVYPVSRSGLEWLPNVLQRKHISMAKKIAEILLTLSVESQTPQAISIISVVSHYEVDLLLAATKASPVSMFCTQILRLC